jgi:hypothetical protein
MKTFHHGDVKKSKRLKRVLALLVANPKGVTTLGLCRLANTTRPSSDVSECRKNNYNITATYEGLSVRGEKIYRYKLI